MAQSDFEDGAVAARLATRPNSFLLGETQVIGTFGSPGARRALLRFASGRTQTIANGDAILGGRVVKVAKDGVEILRAGRLERYPLASGSGLAASLRPRPRPASERGDNPRARTAPPARGDLQRAERG